MVYNLMHGFSPGNLFILPMLGKRIEEYPRHRDCFLYDPAHSEYDGYIHLFTRTGGGNREHFMEQNRGLMEMEGYVANFDDGFDNTFASWVFEVPERWQSDYGHALVGATSRFSDDYKGVIRGQFKKLMAAGIFERMFSEDLPAQGWPGNAKANKSWQELYTKPDLSDFSMIS